MHQPSSRRDGHIHSVYVTFPPHLLYNLPKLHVFFRVGLVTSQRLCTPRSGMSLVAAEKKKTSVTVYINQPDNGGVSIFDSSTYNANKACPPQTFTLVRKSCHALPVQGMYAGMHACPLRAPTPSRTSNFVPQDPACRACLAGQGAAAALSRMVAVPPPPSPQAEGGGALRVLAAEVRREKTGVAGGCCRVRGEGR